MIHRVFASVLLLASLAMAQAGLPKYGVLLGGSVSSPTIVNNSSHRILAYTLLFDQGNGAVHPSLYEMLGQLRKLPMSSVGIAPGVSLPHNPSAQVRDAKGQSPYAVAIAVSLDSVLFDDGTLVGPDKAGSFDQLTARIQAEKDIHAILLNGNGAESAWAALSGIASGQAVAPTQASRSQPYQGRYASMYKVFAAELLRVRSGTGDAAALHLAGSSMSYPTIVKGE